MKLRPQWPITIVICLIIFTLVAQVLVSLGFRNTEHKIFPDDRRKVILIGDSITEQGYSLSIEGWVSGLADWYHRSADVFNRGYSGYNSNWVSAVVHQLFPMPMITFLTPYRKDLMLVVIFLGANDSVSPGEPQHVPVVKFSSNIREMVIRFQRLNPDISIVIVTPCAVNHELWPTRHNSQVELYAIATRQLAQELNIGCVDTWSGANTIDIVDLSDGLHLAAPGNSKLLNNLKDVIRSKYPRIVPENDAHGLPNLDRQYPHSSAFRELSEQEASQIIASWNYLKQPLAGNNHHYLK